MQAGNILKNRSRMVGGANLSHQPFKFYKIRSALFLFLFFAGNRLRFQLVQAMTTVYRSVKTREPHAQAINTKWLQYNNGVSI